MSRLFSYVVAMLLVAFHALVPERMMAQQGGDEPPATNLILLITDGGGVGTWSVARLARGDALAVARMPVVGLVDTRNADGGVTDSGAGATAYATGLRTFSRALSVTTACRALMKRQPEIVDRDPAGCAPAPTLLEHAEHAGKATGLVTTTSITDATPAAFAAHAPSRDLKASIARQTLASGVDVLLGGGRDAFEGWDWWDGSTDLLAPACADADCPRDWSELRALPATGRRLIGLFAGDDLPRAGSRAPDLPSMTDAALDRLSLDPDGLFLLVETEATDSRQHSNDDLAAIEAEILEFDRAVAVALDFADRVPRTLVVVTADHETGGLSIVGEPSTPRRELRYTTDHHTDAMVPLFAAGPGAERLTGMLDNDTVGRILRELLIGIP